MDLEALVDDSAPALRRLAPAASLLLRRLDEAALVERLHRRDAALWHPAPETQAAIRARLGWLDPPRPEDARAARAQGQHWLSPAIQTVLVVATGGAGTLARLWRARADGQHSPRLRVLDSLEPTRVRAILQGLDPRRTLALLVMPHAPGLIQDALARIVAGWLGDAGIRRRLVALVATEEAQAQARALEAQTIVVPADVGERWAALSRLGLLLAGLAGIDVEALTHGARAMLDACLRPDLARNPGARLGVLLGALAQAGHDLLEFTPPLAAHPLNDWLALLLLGSLCKHRRGWAPITAGWPARRAHRHRLVIAASRPDEPGAAPEVPRLSYTVADTAALGAFMMGWQVAVAVAAITLGLNPFDQPDTDALDAALRRRLEHGAPATVAEPMPLAAAALAQARWALLATYGVAEQQARLAAEHLRERHALPVCLLRPLETPAWATQVAHAGRADAPVLVLAQPPRADLPIPGRAWSLADLWHGRLAIDLTAWQRAGRQVGCPDLPGATA